MPLFNVGTNGLRIVFVEFRRHVERALLQIIPAAPAANRPDLTMPFVGRHVARQSDDDVAIVRPIDARSAIVFVGSFEEVRIDVKSGFMILRESGRL